MSFTKIWVHCVWTTKNRETILRKDIRQKVFEHIKENSDKKDIYIRTLNGYSDHVHCLICLKKEQNIAECLRLLKGESSYWINKRKFFNSKFNWQDDYFAVSIGPSQVNDVVKYIDNQENHHKLKPFIQEYDEFIKNYNFK